MHQRRRRRRRRHAFTLMELMVVITIIVLLLGLAIPAFNLIRGSRSVDAAENQISGLVAKARADAIGLQKPCGVMFFFKGDPAEERCTVAEVVASDYPETGGPTRDVYLDLMEDVDFLQLQPGVVAFTLNSGGVLNKVRTSDGYLGYNFTLSGPNAPTTTQTGASLGGVILFGYDGQLISRTWGYRTGVSDGTNGNVNGKTTQMGTLLIGANPKDGFVEAGPAQANRNLYPGSSLGFVIVDMPTLLDVWGGGTGGVSALADPIMNQQAYGPAELNKESWIDENGTPLLINRYNGTLVRSE
jgi:prepilin-type N-terminal cleavage/methylation domain-containing protein